MVPVRAGIHLAAFVMLVASAPAAEPQVPAGSQADALLTRARAALGGEARLGAVRTFALRGSIARGAGSSQDYGHFRIECRLPDGYVRFKTITSAAAAGGASVDVGGTSPTGVGAVGPSFSDHGATLGFEGPRLVYEPHFADARRMVRAAPSVVEALLLEARREFVRLTLALFATSFAGAPVQFAADPDEANALIVTGVGAPIRVAFDPDTHLPARVDDIAYEDHREVSGVKVPFRMSLTGGGSTLEVWTLKEVRINVPFDGAGGRR